MNKAVLKHLAANEKLEENGVFENIKVSTMKNH